MIRREVPAPDGTSAAWILIAQIDHAHLAADLARHWGSHPFSPLQPRDALLWACEHHDDGWAAWDSRPQVDESSGTPRQFLEMQPAESIDIWTQSIAAAAARGPLEAYLVAQHFCRLGHRVTDGHQADPAWHGFLPFLDDYEARCRNWLDAWQADDRSARTVATAERAVDELQFFDSFSLWFCCSPSTECETVETPQQIDLKLRPHGTTRVGLSPWPLSVDMLELSVPGRLIPARRYANAADLAAEPGHTVRLTWQLVPA